MAEEIKDVVVEVVEPVEVGILGTENVSEGEEKEVIEEIVNTEIDGTNEETEKEEEVEVEEPIEPSFDAEDFKEFDGVLNMDKVKSIFDKLDEKGSNPKEILKEQIKELAMAYKDDQEKQKVVAKAISVNPPKGVNMRELNGWVIKQGGEIQKIAQELTKASNGEESVRAGIKLINMLRVGKSNTIGSPETTLGTMKITKDKFLSEYEDIQLHEKGSNIFKKLKALKERVKNGGDKDLIELSGYLIK